MGNGVDAVVVIGGVFGCGVAVVAIFLNVSALVGGEGGKGVGRDIADELGSDR